MTREEKIFEMAKAIAPIFTQKGVELQQRLIDVGANPENCDIQGKSIPNAYSECIKEWATAIVDELEKEEVNNEEVK